MHFLQFLKLVRTNPTTISEADASSVHSATNKAMKSFVGQLFRGVDAVSKVVARLLGATIGFVVLYNLAGPESERLLINVYIATLLLLIIGSWRNLRLLRANELSAPISEREDHACARARHLCEESPGSEELRKAIVARGEPLRYFHYLEMIQIAGRESRAEKLKRDQHGEKITREARIRDCQRLHDIA